MAAYQVAVSVANLYAEPSSSSEMLTQALFGAVVQEERAEDDFVFVATEDLYHGWISRQHLAPIWSDIDQFKRLVRSLFAPVHTAPDTQAELLTKLVLSTQVSLAPHPQEGEWVPVLLPSSLIGYVHQDNLALQISYSDTGRNAVAVGKQLIGTPYLWGGCTPFGVDCSGFVQLAYRMAGVSLLRDAWMQYADRRFTGIEDGKPINRTEYAAGDLLTFSRREDRRITHIGLALGDGRFLHSLGGRGVGIDSCDTSRFVESYIGAARLLPNADPAIQAA